MSTTLCPIRRTTIVQVTRPPLGLWRFHWHELFPVARGNNGQGRMAVFLPEVEPGEGRRAVCSRLREALADLPPENGSRVVVEGCMVEVLEGREVLLPDFAEADLDDFLASLAALAADGNATNGNAANGNAANGNGANGNSANGNAANGNAANGNYAAA